MGQPDALLLLDALARRYHTDPLTVLEWDSERLAFAVACYEQAMASADQMSQNKDATVFPVVIIGSM